MKVRNLIFLLLILFIGCVRENNAAVCQKSPSVDVISKDNNTTVYLNGERILLLKENRYLVFRATNKNDHWIGETNKMADLGWSYQDMPGYTSDSVTYQVQPGYFKLYLYGTKPSAGGKIQTTITAIWNANYQEFEYTLSSVMTADLEKYYQNSKWAVSSFASDPSASVQVEAIDYNIERISILDRIVGENPNPDLYDCFVQSYDSADWTRIPKLHVAYPIYKGNWIYTFKIPLNSYWGFLDPSEGGWISKLVSCSGNCRVEICWSWQDQHFLITDGLPPRSSAKTFTTYYTLKFIPVNSKYANEVMNVAHEIDWIKRPEYIRPVFSRDNDFEELINGYESQHAWFSSDPSCKWDGNVGYNSKSSVSIDKAFSRTAAWYGWFYGYPFDTEHIDINAFYVLSAMVKTENVTGNVRLAAVRKIKGPDWLYSNLYPENSWTLDKVASTQLSGTNDWTELKVRFKSCDWSPTTISLEMDGAGKCWFDDVRIIKE